MKTVEPEAVVINKLKSLQGLNECEEQRIERLVKNIIPSSVDHIKS